MPICVPIRDMEDTAEFMALVAREHDVTVTKNGYDAFHCLSDDQYRLMQDEVAKARLLSRMMLAEREIDAHAYSSFDEFTADVRDGMAQLPFYIDDATLNDLRDDAKAQGQSISAYARDVLANRHTSKRERWENGWPPGFFDLFGSCPSFPQALDVEPEPVST